MGRSSLLALLFLLCTPRFPRRCRPLSLLFWRRRLRGLRLRMLWHRYRSPRPLRSPHLSRPCRLRVRKRLACRRGRRLPRPVRRRSPPPRVRLRSPLVLIRRRDWRLRVLPRLRSLRPLDRLRTELLRRSLRTCRNARVASRRKAVRSRTRMCERCSLHSMIRVKPDKPG